MKLAYEHEYKQIWINKDGKVDAEVLRDICQKIIIQEVEK